MFCASQTVDEYSIRVAMHYHAPFAFVLSLIVIVNVMRMCKKNYSIIGLIRDM